MSAFFTGGALTMGVMFALFGRAASRWDIAVLAIVQALLAIAWAVRERRP